VDVGCLRSVVEGTAVVEGWQVGPADGGKSGMASVGRVGGENQYSSCMTER